jgi:hypothetical protein
MAVRKGDHVYVMDKGARYYVTRQGRVHLPRCYTDVTAKLTERERLRIRYRAMKKWSKA